MCGLWTGCLVTALEVKWGQTASLTWHSSAHVHLTACDCILTPHKDGRSAQHVGNLQSTHKQNVICASVT